MAQRYDQRITTAVTSETFQNLKLLAKRQKTSVGDLVRQAVREHLDHQEDVIGSRSRTGSRIVRQLQGMQDEFLRQNAQAHTLLLAAIILQQMGQGSQGREVLDRIGQLVEYAGDEIRTALKGSSS